jgi:tripartite ATP-independent transporter DctP family solute receptor
MRMMKAAFTVLTAVCVFGLTIAESQDKPLSLTAADVVAPDSHLGKSMDFFAKRVNELSGGKVKIEVFHAGALGGERDVLENVRGGSIHFAAPGTAILGIWYRPAEVNVYPYLFKDEAHKDRVWDKWMPEFSAELEQAGKFKALAQLARPPRNLSANKAVRTVEDMKGLKIRVPETKLWIETFKRFGASPTAMAFPEVYTGLKTKIIDGQENDILNTFPSGFFEVNKYYSLIRHMMQDNLLVTNSSWFAGLPQPVKESILKASQETVVYCRQLSQSEEQRLFKRAKDEYNVEIIEPDLTSFRKSVDGLINDFPYVKKWYDLANSVR